jgi:predicted O-methyltransferase YrrM
MRSSGEDEAMIQKVGRKVVRARELLREPPPADAPHPETSVRLDSLNAARLLFFDHVIGRTADVPGDIVECGVGTGTSLLLMAHVVHARQMAKHLWGFDSFEGFPDPGEEDASYRNARRGEWAIPKDAVLQLLSAHLGDELFFRSKISLVQGFFETSLLAHRGPISLLHLDCDLYDSYRLCLEELYPKVSPGGVIVFDEYHREAHVWPGAPKAIDEFFADKPVEFEKDPLYGKFFVTKPRA